MALSELGWAYSEPVGLKLTDAVERVHSLPKYGWALNFPQLKVHLDRLEELKYIYPRRAGMRGSAYEYELLFDGDTDTAKPQLIGLIDLEKLGYDKKFTGQMAEFAGSKRPQNGAFTGSSLAAQSSGKAASSRSLPKSKNAQAGHNLHVVVS